VIDSPPSSLPDLRRASLANLRTIDLRGPDRDFWADEAAIRDRFVATWAGLADEAWTLPGAAPSDAGGPDWSLAEHVGHVADWQELAIDYIGVALETGRWPSDDDSPDRAATLPRSRSSSSAIRSSAQSTSLIR